MTLQLSGHSERLPTLLQEQMGKEYAMIKSVLKKYYGGAVFRALDEPHREFCGGIEGNMPRLLRGEDIFGNVVDVPRVPASFAYVLERRMGAPDDVRPAWQTNYFFTGDGSTTGTGGDHLIVLDAQHFRELTAESELYQGALVLADGSWNELKSQKENVFHLTTEEVQEANGQGYVKKNGVWTPANRTVGKVLDILNKGQDLTSYLQLASERLPHSTTLLKVTFNCTTKDGKPTMRPWTVDRIHRYSFAVANHIDLDTYQGRVVGIVPTGPIVQGRELEAIVQSILQQRTAVVLN